MNLDLSNLNDAEAYALLYDWDIWARHNQKTPTGDWTYWLILAGRGFGKTRTGAEWVRESIKTSKYVNLIGATADDARDIMIEGESGILAICPYDERPEYKKSERKLVWPNGATSLIFTADEPERLRGKQHEKIWADELAAWRYPEAWTQAKLGLRLGSKPQACLTTTPRPTPIIKEIASDKATHITKGTTYDNKANLAPSFFGQIIKAYEGTRLGRQELNAEILDDNPNALWNRSKIDEHRVSEAPDLIRVVVGIDPAVTANKDSDLTGIVVAGVGKNQHGYVLDEKSTIASPDEWARLAVKLYHEYKADRIVAEVNNGGDLVEMVIRTIDTGVVNTGNTLTYSNVYLESVNLVMSVPVSFGGSGTKVLTDGVTDVVSDPILPSLFGLSKFTVGERYFVRGFIDIPISGSMPYANYYDCALSTAASYDTGATTCTNISGTGVLTYSGAGTTASSVNPPLLVGRFVGSDANTWLGVGDSINEGYFDTTGRAANAVTDGLHLTGAYHALAASSYRAKMDTIT
jgi:phage terminase large subunit-like protein